MKRLVMVLASVLVLLLSVIAANAQGEAPCFFGGYTDETSANCVYRVGVDIDITYSNWVNDYDFAREAVLNFLAQTRDPFWEAATADLSTMFNPWMLHITPEDFTYGSDTRSILFTISDYTGGAHPNTYYKTFVFNLAQERQITLDDLFTDTTSALALVSPIVQQHVIDQLGGDYTDSQWLEDGTGTNPDNYQNFVLTEEGLIFVFPPYQLAAYAAGSFRVTISYEMLADVLEPEFQGVG
jgi:hypothetical protein